MARPRVASAMSALAARLRDLATVAASDYAKELLAEAIAALESSDAAREAAIRECAALVAYRGKCAVQMINADERIEEKKAYAWDALQHEAAILALAAKGAG